MSRSTPYEGKNVSISYHQYHGCWWPGNTRRQGISRHDTDLVFVEYSTTGKSSCSDYPLLLWLQLDQCLQKPVKPAETCCFWWYIFAYDLHQVMIFFWDGQVSKSNTVLVPGHLHTLYWPITSWQFDDGTIVIYPQPMALLWGIWMAFTGLSICAFIYHQKAIHRIDFKLGKWSHYVIHLIVWFTLVDAMYILFSALWSFFLLPTLMVSCQKDPTCHA